MKNITKINIIKIELIYINLLSIGYNNNGENTIDYKVKFLRETFIFMSRFLEFV